MQNINFWNGNKTSARQAYETELLDACLNFTENEYGPVHLQVDNTNYPLAQDESNIFDAGADILVTVAGNLKFKEKPKIMIAHPLTRGLLGYRLIVIPNESRQRFKNITNASTLQALSIGIPETWADAGLFRENNYRVVEQGDIDDLFLLLKKGVFDYTALGVNEIEAVFTEHAAPLGGISIEPSLLLYYPFPLVFYVNHRKPALAERVKAGLSGIMDDGRHGQIFQTHHGNIVQRLRLKERNVFKLHNSILPEALASFSPTLLD